MGRRTLVCELNTQEQIPALFGRSPVGPAISPLAENLFCVNIDPECALEEYALMKLRFRALYRLLFENSAIKALISFIPGMRELLMLGKAFHHERQRHKGGAPVWDQIIIDAPATGHGIPFFRLPKVIYDVVPSGNMHREAKAMWSLLSDPARCAIHLVTLAESLPVQETLELHTQLSLKLQLPMGCLFLNQLSPALFDLGLKEQLEHLSPCFEGELKPLWEASTLHLRRRREALRYRKKLEPLMMPILELPQLPKIQLGPEDLSLLGESLR